MLLAIDVGNTNIVYGLFDGERLAHQFRVESGRARTADEYAVVLRSLLDMHGVDAEAIAQRFEQQLFKLFHAACKLMLA